MGYDSGISTDSAYGVEVAVGKLTVNTRSFPAKLPAILNTTEIPVNAISSVVIKLIPIVYGRHGEYVRVFSSK
jgi:hypothetical protein